MEDLLPTFERMKLTDCRHKVYEIFEKALPTVFCIIVESELSTRNRTHLRFIKKTCQAYQFALERFPPHLPKERIEKLVVSGKRVQDSIGTFIQQNEHELISRDHYDECSAIYTLTDILILKCLYLHPIEKHPHMLKKEDYNAMTEDQKLFNRIFKIFFYYNTAGCFSRMVHVYMNLTEYIEAEEVMFLKNVRLGVYERKVHKNCQICLKDVFTKGPDYVVLGMCGHLMCIPCSDRESVTRHAMYCVKCDQNIKIWIRKSMADKNWKVSKLSSKALLALKIPTVWYSIVPEPFYDVISEDGMKVFTSSFGISGFFGSVGCLKVPKLRKRNIPTLHEDLVEHEKRIVTQCALVETLQTYNEEYIRTMA